MQATISTGVCIREGCVCKKYEIQMWALRGMYIKEEVREDGYMQAGLRVPYYCC
jgi:hypothetical protein